ncbi:PREDICTED: uncharacterized protein LOC109352995 [Lupinus angustifolius]|uniref:uncharacterized protein LOC109352995 n=1 Tax=Lupinus angustifolius TaxID=3871 RepID=UPI00092EE7FC|nr:PREDICTED: uncharacterized protein LOC109352995 [Lupinus angustifolius]
MKRCVRQVDPLSPILFCIAEDVLSRRIRKLVSDNKLSLISGPKWIQTPSHVLYADDILIFCKGKKRELHCLMNLIKDYAAVSGQQISLDKFKFYTSTSNPRRISSLSNYLGFSVGCLPVTYLGVPLFKGKPRKIQLQHIADKITAKLATWKGNSLSIMGRVKLVRSIIQSMLVNNFHIYKWPAQLLKDMDKCIRNFIWFRDTGTRKLVIVAWHKVCCPLNEGGLV